MTMTHQSELFEQFTNSFIELNSTDKLFVANQLLAIDDNNHFGSLENNFMNKHSYNTILPLLIMLYPDIQTSLSLTEPDSDNVYVSYVWEPNKFPIPDCIINGNCCSDLECDPYDYSSDGYDYSSD